MWYRLLGSLVIGDPDRPVSPGGPRQARLLAALLLRSGQTVPISYLVDVVWDEDPPSQAVKVVRNLVSALRGVVAHAGGPAAITTTGGGYRLDLPDEAFDLAVFRRLRQEADRRGRDGDLDGASRCLREALDLWRGPVLDGLCCPALAPAMTQLDEQHVVTWEQLADVELRLGHADRLVGPLSELATAHPVREHLHRRLMLALRHTGRRVEALDVYRRLHERVREELGLDPDSSVQDLHQRILTGDTTPAAPAVAVPGPAGPFAAVVPRQLPAAVRHFTGRTDELKALDGMLDHQGAPTVVISALGGTGGIGKTALALHWAHRVAAHYPDGQLYLNLRGFDPGSKPMAPAKAIRRVLDALGFPPARIPVEPDAQALLYRSVLADRRLLILLDNARDAQQVRPLLAPASAS